MPLRQRLGLPAELPTPLLVACILYLLHLVLQAWAFSSETAAFTATGLVMVCMATGRIRTSFHILYFPLFLYALASSVSAAVNTSSHTFLDFGLWSKMFLFPAALILFREIPRMRELALRAHIGFALFIAGSGLVQYFALQARDLEHRITGTAAHVMTYSGLLLPTALLLLVLALNTRKPWLYAAAIAVTLALTLTFTRSAWFGWLVAVFTLLLFTKPRWTFYAAVALLWGIIFAPLPIFGRFISAFDTRRESNLDRIRMVEGGIEIIKDYPLLGVGPANMKGAYILYRKHDAPRFRVPHLHNNIVQIWAERGIVALIAYALLLYLFLRECARNWRGPRRVWAQVGVCVAVALACAGWFEFNFGDTEVFWIMLDLYALVIASMESWQAPRYASNEAQRVLVPAA